MKRTQGLCDHVTITYAPEPRWMIHPYVVGVYELSDDDLAHVADCLRESHPFVAAGCARILKERQRGW